MADKKFMEGIPTADEEALQAPSVDPISGVGLAAGFGPAAAGKLLFQQILLNALLPQLGRLNNAVLPATNPDAIKYSAYKSRMTPSGVRYDTLRGAHQWLQDKMLESPEGSFRDKLFSRILERLPEVRDYTRDVVPP